MDDLEIRVTAELENALGRPPTDDEFIKAYEKAYEDLETQWEDWHEARATGN